MSTRSTHTSPKSVLTSVKTRATVKLLRNAYPVFIGCGMLALQPAFAASTVEQCLSTDSCSSITSGSTPYVETGTESLLDGHNKNVKFSVYSSGEALITYEGRNDSSSHVIQNFGQVTVGENGIAQLTKGGFQNLPRYRELIHASDVNLTIRNSAFFSGSLSGTNVINFYADDNSEALFSLEESSVYSLTLADGANFLTLAGGRGVIRNSVFDSLRGSTVGSAIHSSGNLLQIDNSLFNYNQASSSGGAVNAGIGGESFGGLTIRNTTFTKNTSLNKGGAITIQADSNSAFYISGSEFASNSAVTGGALYMDGLSSPVLTIRDTDFSNNYAKEEGGAVYINPSKGTAVLNILADEKDVTFSDNKAVYEGADLAVTNTTVNISAAEGRTVTFNGDIATTNTSSYDESGTVININKSGVTYSYAELDVESSKTAEHTETAKTGGNVVFKSTVSRADIRLYGGTLTLLSKEAASAETGPDGQQETYRSNQDYSDKDLVTTFLDDVELTVEGNSALRTRTVSAIFAGSYEAGSAAAAIADAKKLTISKLQVIPLGWRMSLNANLAIQPAVNLKTAATNGATAESDKYSLYSEGSELSGSGKLVVDGWLVVDDDTDLKTVCVDLAFYDNDNLKNAFALDTKGTIAVGPVHVWQVSQKEEGSSVFVFTLPSDESAYFDKFTAMSEAETENLISVHSETTPFDYNPDLYGAQVAAMGTAVIQHTISDVVFSEAGGFGAVFASDEVKPERREWWGKAVGSSLELKTKNFYDTDYSFGLAMVGRQFAPIKTEAGNIEFGAYVGAATGSAKYADSTNKVRQSGAFTGGSVILRNGGFFMGANATVGLMQNKLSGVSSNSFSAPWFGVGAAAGFTFDIPRAGLGITPSVELSYVSMTTKNYTTSLGTEVKNSGMNSFEASPGFRFDKRFGDGFSAFAKARYAFVTKQPGDTSASYNGVSTALPSISNKNYSEIGVGLQKETKDFGLSLNVSRSDGGRSGWTGSVRATWRF